MATEIRKEIDTPYTTAQMFDLVTNIEQYPEFISWCKKTVVQSRKPNQIRASLIGNKLGNDFGVNFVYGLFPNSMIQVTLMETGPFRIIDILWRFTQTDKGSKLILELKYELSSIWLRWTLSPVIKNETSNILKEFLARANTIYKK